MPMYDWIDKKTGKVVSIIRSFSEYQVPPTLEEAPDSVEPDWERQIGGNQSVVKGHSWGPGKGNW